MKNDLDIRVAIIEDDETIREGYAFIPMIWKLR